MSGGANPSLTVTVKDTNTTPDKPLNPFNDVKESDW